MTMVSKEKCTIESEIGAVISYCTGIPFDEIVPHHQADPLTGSFFNLSPVDLVYILFEIENKFKIAIKAELLEQYGFASFDSICTVVQVAFNCA